jgi:myo-inositol-1(or 4)-monophosphatase
MLTKIKAGVVIAQEAGCLVSGGSQSPHDGVVTAAILTGRKHIVVRRIADSVLTAGRARQVEVIKEFFGTVEEWDAV